MHKDFYLMVADFLTEQEAKEDRRYLRPWVGAVISGACLAALFVLATSAYAEPVARATAGGIQITVYNEPCKLKDQVSNLPHRATWLENGRTFEGCVGPNIELGVAIFYFKEDKSVAAVPLQMFAPVTGV